MYESPINIRTNPSINQGGGHSVNDNFYFLLIASTNPSINQGGVIWQMTTINNQLKKKTPNPCIKLSTS